MKLGIDFVIAGHAPLFEKRAKVTSRFPTNEAGLVSQRRRWEHGHLSMIVDMLPPLVKRGIRDGRGALLAIALDLTIPPLSLLVLLLFFALSGIRHPGGSRRCDRPALSRGHLDRSCGSQSHQSLVRLWPRHHIGS